MGPQERKQGFAILGQCDLDFDPKGHIFKLDIEIIKTNLQTNFQDIWIKKVVI
jgi:hypothetical protein